MESRPFLLIKRELDRLKRFPLWGVEIELYTPENIYVWRAKIRGLRNTIWEAGIFQVILQFSPSFNAAPPKVWFHTIPFHPNIDMGTGRPCLNMLEPAWWNDAVSMHSVLLTLQDLLSNPVLEEAVNEEAANTLVHAPDVYHKLAHDCIQASIRVNAGLPPFDPNMELATLKQAFPTPHVRVQYPSTRDDPKSRLNPALHTPTQLLSFDDYSAFWRTVGTSQQTRDKVSSLVQKVENETTGLFTEDELKDHLQKQLEHHTLIMYGRFGKQAKPEKKKADKMEKVEMMKKVYLKQKTMNTPLSTARETTFDREASELVNWASNLPPPENAALDEY